MSKYTRALDDKICMMLATGNSLVSVCQQVGIDYSTVKRWLASKPEFCARYARAREDQADYLADEIIAIADDGSRDYKESAEGVALVDHDHIARSRLRVDARKWAASKLAPKKYGDKIQAEHTGKDGAPLIPSQILTDDQLKAEAIARGLPSTIFKG